LPLALAAGLALTVLASAVPAHAGTAEDGGGGSVTWSVAPATAEGPDGRHWVELALAPGDSATEHMAITNLSQEAVTFALASADGYFTATGRFNMLSNPAESVDAGTWIEIQDAVTVEADETAVVPFTVTVPADAQPGDHAGGVAAAVKSSGAGSEGGAGLGVTSRFGFRVMTRVLGELEPLLEVANPQASYTTAWNPAQPGQLRIGFDLVNKGNSRLTVTGRVAAGGGTAAFPGREEPAIELLPGDTRRVEVRVAGVWPLFRVTAKITAEPVVLAVDDARPPELKPVTATVGAFAMPWPQCACAAGIGLLIAAWLVSRGRSRRRIARIVAQAKAEALAEAAGQPKGGPAPRLDPAD
jgi:hypothetical protein